MQPRERVLFALDDFMAIIFSSFLWMLSFTSLGKPLNVELHSYITGMGIATDWCMVG
jgi:hypothetical protein